MSDREACSGRSADEVAGSLDPPGPDLDGDPPAALKQQRDGSGVR